MKKAIPHVLWLDDQLVPERQSYIAPWFNWFDQQQKKSRLRWTSCSRIEQMAKAMQVAAASLQADSADRIDLLVIDVMLKPEGDDFRVLGYPKEQLLRMEAGVQLVGLMRNAQHEVGRPDWLACHRQTPVLLLSASALVAGLLAQHVPKDCRADLFVISKSLGEEGRDGATVSPDFQRMMDELLARVIGGGA
jgi:hypothetical protein